MAMIRQYQKKNGESAWYFKTYLGVDPLTGKKRYTTKRGFRTQKEAKLALAKLELDVEKTGIKTQINSTFKEAAEMWLCNYRKTVTASSYSRTEIIFNKHIYPKFGNLKIDKITPSLCQRAINDWHDNGSSKQYPLFLNYMNKVFKFAINIGIANNNPTLNVMVPTPDKKINPKLKLYNKEQLECFLNTVQNETNPYLKARDYTLFRLLSFSGCRIGEVLALTWHDIDFSKRELTVNKTIAKSTQYYVSKTPKTKKSFRKIVLDDKTLSQLKKWRLTQTEYLFKLGYSKATHIFTNEKNEFTINQAVTDRYRLYQERAGLPYIGLHGFRHTHASILYNAGADHKEVQERLGHANIKTTMDTYTHLSDDKKEETTQKLVKYIDF